MDEGKKAKSKWSVGWRERIRETWRGRSALRTTFTFSFHSCDCEVCWVGPNLLLSFHFFLISTSFPLLLDDDDDEDGREREKCKKRVKIGGESLKSYGQYMQWNISLLHIISSQLFSVHFCSPFHNFVLCRKCFCFRESFQWRTSLPVKVKRI